MKVLDKTVDGLDKVLNFIIYSLFLILLIFGIYSLRSSLAILDDSELPKDIVKFRPSKRLSLEELKKINKDIVGWIRVDNTHIDYPIVQGKDNIEYLNKDYKREFSLSGSIFMDYRNNPLEADPYTVIFGHNMDREKMFGDVNNFKDMTYFKQHKKGKLYLGKNVYKIKLYAYMLVDGYSNMIYDINQYHNGINEKLINFIESSADVYLKTEISTKDKLIVLSTCSRSDEKKRTILIGKIKS
ncbi:MAG: class B sortase [Bacilli bacterium]|nr:class B sortase [Bacilli bacterium]